MHARRLTLITPIALLALATTASLCILSGCQSSATMREPNDQSLALVGDWNLITISGTDVRSQLTPGAQAPSLSFTANSQVTGFSGVNRLRGTYDVAAARSGKISLGQLITTRMAGTPAMMRLEQQFLPALGQIDSFSFDQKTGGLYLKKGNDSMLYFTRAK